MVASLKNLIESDLRHVLVRILAGTFAVLLFAIGNVAWSQEDEGTQDSEEEAEEADSEHASEVPMEELVVTGSRISRSPGDLANQLIVIGEEEIQAAGEVTLERLLRQLPQNQNPTTEQFGQRLNTGTNFSGASTVNLRGLGSESTLILIDGKRVGASGILGGVTDVSSIPLSMVERIEVVLDGASAIYGSDAVGGVVNVITKKDYEQVNLNLNLDFPSDGAYTEFRGGIATTQNMGNMRISGSFNHSRESGLDAADRDEAIFSQSNFPGPQFDVSWLSGLPIFYRLDGNNITIAEYNALSSDDRSRAVSVAAAVLPPDWTSSSSLNAIEELEAPNWGAATQEGYSVIPQASKNSLSGSIETALSDMISAAFDLRYESRTTTFEEGYITFSGAQSMHQNNPFNPFGSRVYVRGQRRDIGATPFTETDSSTLDWTASVQGDLTDAWSFEGSFGQTTTELEAGRYNQLDSDSISSGLNTDGVTPITRFLPGLTAEECAAMGGVIQFGFCRVQVDPPDAIDPWGDLSSYISSTPLMSSSENGLTRLEGLVRGELFSLPGGQVRALGGFSWSNVLLETITEFSVGIIENSPISNVADINTTAERANSSFFMEMSVPLIGEDNASEGIDGLTLSFSARNDSYDTPDVTYTRSDDSSEDAGDYVDIGGKTTWGMGLVYSATDGIRVRFSSQSSFVVPQLNQLLLETSEGPNAPFRGLYLIQPDGSLQYVNAVVKGGGNPDLLPETADSLSLGFDFRIPSIPLFGAKLTWSTIDYQDRISLLSTSIFSPDSPPSNASYDPDTDTWFQDRRWVNVSSVERTGIDLELNYGWSLDNSLFNFRWRRSQTSSYDFVLDPATDSAINIVGDVTDAQGQASLIPPVSKSRDSMQFTWESGRLNASLDLNTSSKTSRTFGATTSAITTEYTPPTLLDFTLNFDLDEVGWFPMPSNFTNSRLLLTINNITNAFGESKTFNADGEEFEPSSPSGSPLYGMVIHLTFNTGLRSN